MNILSLFKNTNDNNHHILIWGDDSFLNDYITKSITQSEQYKNFDQIIVDCESDGLDELIASLTESSLFATQKVIVVKNPVFLTANSSKKQKQKQLAQLQDIFANSSQLEDIIVIEASYNKIDRRKKLPKILWQTSMLLILKLSLMRSAA